MPGLTKQQRRPKARVRHLVMIGTGKAICGRRNVKETKPGKKPTPTLLPACPICTNIMLNDRQDKLELLRKIDLKVTSLENTLNNSGMRLRGGH